MIAGFYALDAHFNVEFYGHPSEGDVREWWIGDGCRTVFPQAIYDAMTPDKQREFDDAQFAAMAEEYGRYGWPDPMDVAKETMHQ